MLRGSNADLRAPQTQAPSLQLQMSFWSTSLWGPLFSLFNGNTQNFFQLWETRSCFQYPWGGGGSLGFLWPLLILAGIFKFTFSFWISTLAPFCYSHALFLLKQAVLRFLAKNCNGWSWGVGCTWPGKGSTMTKVSISSNYSLGFLHVL